MKLVVVGCGQCGGKIADEFARLGKKARSERRIEIINGAFAVNTDTADLSGLKYIKSDYQHRILIGSRRTGGHGVGKVNELGAEIAKEDGDKILDAIRTSPRFFESDAFLIIAGAGGGTGSGSISVLSQLIKERYGDKPMYNLLILPFQHEEETEGRTIYNSSVCLKSADSIADAIFLVDNQRYVKKDSSIRNNFDQINRLIVEPFYNILCAGEEQKRKSIGSKLLDAGDILQTLTGWTVIGYGHTPLKAIRLPFEKTRNFRKKSTEIHRGIEAMDEAISQLSLKCNATDAGRALYLVSGPAKEMNMDLIKELGEYLKDITSGAIIRNGDYPRERALLDVTVILSELRDVAKIRDYYIKSTEFMKNMKIRQVEIESKLKVIDEAAKDIPSLL